MERAGEGHPGEGLEPLQEFSSLFQEQRETDRSASEKGAAQAVREAQSLGAGAPTCVSGSGTTVRRLPHPKPRLSHGCNDANSPHFVQVVVNETKRFACNSKPVLITYENT